MLMPKNPSAPVATKLKIVRERSGLSMAEVAKSRNLHHQEVSMLRVLIPLALALAGCASSGPITSDFNGDSVKIKVACGLNYACQKPRPEDQAAADRLCSTRGRKAEYASTAPANVMSANGVMMENYEHLYICV